MSLQELIHLVPPPAKPQHAAGDWPAAEAKLGIALPADYKGIVERYGAGAFSDFLIVLNPFTPNAYLNLQEGGAQILESARTVRASDPDLYRMPLFPESGGLLPWGVTEAGDTLYWRTTGLPDSWTVVLRRSSDPLSDVHAMPCSTFLTEWLGRRSLAAVFEGSAHFPAAEFVPFRKTYLLTAFLAPAPGEFEDRLGRLMRHFEAERVKTRYRGWQGFNQCSFRGGPFEVLIVCMDDPQFGSRLELHVPRGGKEWAVGKLAELPSALGFLFRRIGGATVDFAWAEEPPPGAGAEDE